MPVPEENISSDLFNFLTTRFSLGPGIDESGKTVTKPEDIKVFTFDFVTKNKKDSGCVVISLLDDSSSINSVKIYFGKELSDLSGEAQDEWYAFLQQIRQFAKTHVLGFDVRNINKSTLEKSDLEPMFESTFGPIDGSVKTSRQPLDNMQIVIKHNDRIDPSIKNARSRRIDRIYVTTSNGERFLLPFKSLLAARAMARHIDNGGLPYDSIGKSIVSLVDELQSIHKFIHTMKHNASSPEEISALESGKNRCIQIKKMLSSLISDGGYKKNSPSLANLNQEFPTDEYELFNDQSLDEECTDAIPYIMRAYHSSQHIVEEDEFDQWILSEGDNLSGYYPSPLTYVTADVPNRFRSKKQLKKLQNLSGEISPLSLLNTHDQDESDSVPSSKKGTFE
jgi:hypothetical protein